MQSKPPFVDVSTVAWRVLIVMYRMFLGAELEFNVEDVASMEIAFEYWISGVMFRSYVVGLCSRLPEGAPS